MLYLLHVAFSGFKCTIWVLSLHFQDSLAAGMPRFFKNWNFAFLLWVWNQYFCSQTSQNSSFIETASTIFDFVGYDFCHSFSMKTTFCERVWQTISSLLPVLDEPVSMKLASFLFLFFSFSCFTFTAKCCKWAQEAGRCIMYVTDNAKQADNAAWNGQWSPQSCHSW